MDSYWHKQNPDKALFSDLLWSRPESKHTAGKLLIIGGNVHSFSAVGQAYQAAITAGVGSIRIILPDTLQKTVSKLLPDADFAPSTPSGSFGKLALAQFIDNAGWADTVLLAGDFGRNSETSVVLENFVKKYRGQLVFTKDSVDYFSYLPLAVATRQNTCLIVTMAQLQQIAINLKSPLVFTFNLDLLQLVERLHQFTKDNSLSLILKHLDTLFVAVNGQVSTTPTNLKDEESWRIGIAAQAAVWWLQNPSKPFEAFTTSLIPNKSVLS